MRRLRFWAALALVALGCNEVLGLDAGKPRTEETGGTAGAGDASGSGESGSGGSSTNGGSSSTNGGDGAFGGESGASAGGASGGDRGGNGGSAGAGGDPGPGGAGAGGAPSCSSSQICRFHGYDFCIDGTCADITSPECGVILGDDWIHEDLEAKPYVIGAVSRWGGTSNLQDEPFYWNLMLAMREFGAFGRIPIEGEDRRPVLLLCHRPSEADLAPVEAALDHMVRIGVSSVLMLLESRPELEALVHRTLIERGEDLFFLDVGGGTGWVFNRLLNLPDGGRLWHMRGDSQSLAYPFAPLVERVEELVNPGASTGAAAEPTRLAIVNGTTDQFNAEIVASLSDFYQAILTINGMMLNDQRERVLILSETATEGGQGLYDLIAEFGAHIVIDFSSFGPGLEPFVDMAFADRGLPPPFYVVPFVHRHAGSLVAQLGASPARTRVVGMRAASADDPTLHRAYIDRIRSIAPEVYRNAPEWHARQYDNVYDATYYLIYGAVAGGRGGTEKSFGFRRLISGPQREIGPGGIASVLARLSSSAGATLSLSGPSGDFGFHVPTGGRIAFSNAWCIEEVPVDGTDFFFYDYAFDVLRYDHTSGDLIGTLPCF
jgi:hypothetical protein